MRLVKRAQAAVKAREIVRQARGKAAEMRKIAAFSYIVGLINEKRASEGKNVEKRAKMVKKVPGIGKKPDMSTVVFKFHDKDTGKTKCAAFVEITETDQQRRAGLSKRASMSKIGGMFFDCKGPFWMKDVNFPLDLCYLDEYGRITEKKAMAEDRDGSTLYPRTKTASVHAVELPAGFCDKYGLNEGDWIETTRMVR